jgi:TonB family protein
VGPFLVGFLLLAPPDTPETAALKSPDPEARVATLVALRTLAGPHPDFVEPVANALTDDVPAVRRAAAYTLAQLALGLGCKPTDFLACETFSPLFDDIPIRQTKLELRYPEAAKQARTRGSVVVQFLVNEDGCVAEVTLVRGERILADPVLKTLASQRYKPAKRKGTSVPFVYVFEASFRLW